MSANNDTSKIWDYNDDLTFVTKLFMMNTPFTIFIIWFLYIIFILKLGPQIMKNRPAYKLTNIITAYNIFQGVLAALVCCMGSSILWKHGLNPTCLDNKDDSIGYLRTIHIYYLLKPVELLETVFFILRKKFNQVSFLHVYHHCYMLISSWLILRYDPTYAILFPAVLNSFVHVVMYTYYGMSAFPTLVKYLWWKKYITYMQLIQFVMIILHTFQSYQTYNYPPSFLAAFSFIMNGMLFIILFLNFYIKTYKKPSKTSSENSKITNDVEENDKTEKDVNVNDKNNYTEEKNGGLVKRIVT